MEIEKFKLGAQYLDEIRKLDDIITALESLRIKGVMLADGTIVTRVPRGMFKDAIIAECKNRIEEHKKAIEEI